MITLCEGKFMPQVHLKPQIISTTLNTFGLGHEFIVLYNINLRVSNSLAGNTTVTFN